MSIPTIFLRRILSGAVLLLAQLFCLLSGDPSLLAQQSRPHRSLIEFSTVRGNLSEGTITSIVQDYKGVLWFGTRNGLNRYNGTSFYVYEHDYQDNESLSSTYVNCLMEDSRNNLWVGTVDGLNIYDRNKNSFKRFKHKVDDHSSISHNNVYVIFEDSKKNIWIGTEEGLNKYDPRSGKFSRFLHNSKDPSSLGHNYVRAIFEDDEGNIWVGTYGGGLSRLDLSQNKFFHYRSSPDDTNSISSNYIRTSFIDREGTVWIGTKKGFNRLLKKGADYTFTRYMQEVNNPNGLAHIIIGAISQDSSGKLWLGSENGGLFVYDIKTGNYTSYVHNPKDPASIRHNSIWAIYKDNVGTMWVGMLNKGINKWDQNQSKFNHFNAYASGTSLSNGNVTSFAEDKMTGGKWIGTDGGGLNLYDKETQSFQRFLHNPSDPQSLGSNAVTTVYEDSYNNVWIGTWEGGLNLMDRKTKKFKRFLYDPSDTSSISSNNVFSILEDSRGRLWVGAYEGGLELFNKEDQSFTHFKHDPDDSSSLPSNKVFSIFEDSKGKIWIGTEGGGVSIMDVKGGGAVSFKNYRHDPANASSLGGDVIVYITEDSDNNIWIGTFGGGLSLFDRERESFVTFRKEDGLPGNVIHGILEDDDGHLWISTNDGISKFNKKELTFRNYSVADGLQAREFIRRSAYKMSDGEMLFGGINGFNAFYPETIEDNPNIPPVYITGFSIYGSEVSPGKPDSPLKKHISDTEKITLNYDQNVFSFELSALNYSQASENQYAYKLEGYDKGWQYIGKRRNAYYTKVPPGDYVFKVKGSNNDGVWNEVGTSLLLTITPPWYASGPAYAGYSLILILLLVVYRQNLIHRETLKNDLKLEQMELSKMQEIDQMKSNFFANISHEFRTPLTLILGPLKAMQSGKFEGDLKSQLRMMIRNVDRLMLLINQLLDLSKLGDGSMKLRTSKFDVISFARTIVDSFSSLASSRQIDLNLNVPSHPLDLFFDADKMEKILANLLSNAFKFTERGGKVEINISKKTKEEVKDVSEVPFEEYLLIEVKDSGIGIAAEDLSQIFNRFYQADTTNLTDMKGTGIGLSLTKELVELHHGFIVVESAVQEGTSFKVFMPAGHSHLTPEEIVSTPQNGLINRISDGIQDMSSDEDKLKSETVVRHKTRKDLPVILVVEDNTDLRKYIVNQLQDHYKVLEAEDGIIGYERALEAMPNLVISDVMMPHLNGFDLSRKLKEDERTSHIPILLLTAKTSTENHLKGFETGADYYITKPFDAQLLLLRVRNIIRSKENIQDYLRSKNVILEPKKVNIASSDEKFLRDAIACIEDNMANSNFDVDEFGKSLGISRMQLYRKLKALTGKSANEFIRSLRLKRAAQLLETGELTISEITYEVGFNDLKYFRLCFKKEFGVNPSNFCSREVPK